MTLGEFLSQKRREKKITMRKFAEKLCIAPSFLCDLENGNRAFPFNSSKSELLFDNICSILDLNDEDIKHLKILAEESKLLNNKVTPQISEYLQKVPLAQQALRVANEKGITQEKWLEIIKYIEGK